MKKAKTIPAKLPKDKCKWPASFYDWGLMSAGKKYVTFDDERKRARRDAAFLIKQAKFLRKIFPTK